MSRGKFEKIYRLLYRDSHKSNSSQTSKYDSFLDFTFFSLHKIKETKSLSPNLAFILIFYFYLSMLFNIISTSFEFQNSYKEGQLTSERIQTEGMILIVQLPSHDYINDVMFGIKETLLLRFLNKQIGGYKFLVYTLIQFLFFSLLFALKIKYKGSSYYSCYGYKILCVYFYFIYFVFMQPMLDYTVRVCMKCDFKFYYGECIAGISISSTPIIGLSIATAVLYYLPLYYITKLFFGVNRYNKIDCYNRLSTKFEHSLILYLYIRSILLIGISYFNQIILSVLLLDFLFFLTLFYFYITKIYFYNTLIHNLQLVSIGTCLSSSIISLICYFVGLRSSSLIHLVVCICIAYIIYSVKRRTDAKILWNFVLEENLSIINLEEYIDQLTLLYISCDIEQNNLLYKGIFNYYLKNGKKLKFMNITKRKLNLPFTNEDYKFDSSQYRYPYITLLCLIYDLFEFTISKLGNKFDLLISFSMFLSNTYGNKYKTISNTQKALFLSTKLNEKFICYCLIERFNSKMEQTDRISEKQAGVNLDNPYAIFFYDELTLKFVASILDLCGEHSKIWKKIISLENSQGSESTLKSFRNGSEYQLLAWHIHNGSCCIENLYKEIYEINPTPSFVIDKIYQNYKNYVFEDPVSLRTRNRNKVFDTRISRYSKLFEENSFSVIIDILVEVGKVLNYTKNCPLLLRQHPNFMLDKNINMILPRTIGENHDAYLRRFHKTGKQHIIGYMDRHVHCKDGKNVVLPALITVDFLPFMDFRKIYCIGNIQIQPSIEDFLLVTTSGKIDSCNIKPDSIRINSYFISKVNVFIQFLFPQLINYTRLTEDGRLQMAKPPNFNSYPCFIPSLLLEPINGKDLNLHLKKLGDLCDKLKGLLKSYLSLSELSSENKVKAKEKYFAAIIENSIIYEKRQFSIEKFDMKIFCIGLENEELFYGNNLYQFNLKTNGFADVEHNQIDMTLISLIETYFKKDQKQMPSSIKSKYFIKERNAYSNHSSSESENEREGSCLKSCDEGKSKEKNFVTVNFLPKKNQSFSLGVAYKNNNENIKKALLLKLKISEKSLKGTTDNYESKSCLYTEFENTCKAANIAGNLSISYGFRNPLKHKNFNSNNKVNGGIADDLIVANGKNDVARIEEKFSEIALNLCHENESKNKFSKSQLDDSFKYNLRKEIKEVQSIHTRNSYTSSDSSYNQSIQRIKNGILLKEEPLLLQTTRRFFFASIFLFISIIVFYQLYTSSLTAWLHNFTLSIVAFDNIPSKLACLHSYSRNIFLTRVLEVYSPTRFEFSSQNFLSFSKNRLVNCSYDLNIEVADLESNNLKFAVLNETIDFMNFINSTKSWFITNKGLSIYDSIFEIIQSSISLTTNSPNTKFDIQFNNIFSNALNTVLSKVNSSSYNIIYSYLANNIWKTNLWNAGIIVIIFFVLFLIFSFYFLQLKKLNCLEISVWSVLLENTILPQIKNKCKLLEKFRNNLIHLAKQTFSLTEEKLNAFLDKNIETDTEEIHLAKQNAKRFERNYKAYSKQQVASYNHANQCLKVENSSRRFKEDLLKKIAMLVRRASLFKFILVAGISFFIYLSYLIFIFLFHKNIIESNEIFEQTHQKFREIYFANLFAFILIKEYTLSILKLDNPYSVILNGTAIDHIDVVKYNDDYQTSQSSTLFDVQLQMHDSKDMYQIYNTAINQDLCLIVHGSDDSVELQDCKLIGGGVLTRGLQETLTYFNRNMRAIFLSLHSSDYFLQNYSNEQYLINEQILEFYLEAGNLSVLTSYEAFFKANYNYRDSISQVIMYVSSIFTLAACLIVYKCFYSRLRDWFVVVITLFCILPNEALSTQKVLHKISSYLKYIRL